MKYVLIIQFPYSGEEQELNRILGIEEHLEEVSESMPDLYEVDGHDYGSGEANIFVITDSPVETFETVRLELPDGITWSAAYRGIDEEDYVILWPPGLKEFSVA